MGPLSKEQSQANALAIKREMNINIRTPETKEALSGVDKASLKVKMLSSDHAALGVGIASSISWEITSSESPS